MQAVYLKLQIIYQRNNEAQCFWDHDNHKNRLYMFTTRATNLTLTFEGQIIVQSISFCLLAKVVSGNRKPTSQN